MERSRNSSIVEETLREELDKRTRDLAAASKQLLALREELDAAYVRLADVERQVFWLKLNDAAASSTNMSVDAEQAQRSEARIEQQSNELSMLRSMISTLQGERQAYANYLDALSAAGTTSTRLAIAKAWQMTLAAVRRRLDSVMRRPWRRTDTPR